MSFGLAGAEVQQSGAVLGGGGAAALAAGGPIGLAVAGAITLIGGVFGARQSSRQKRKARDALAVDSRATFANAPIPIAYGYAKLNALNVWAEANAHLPFWYAPGSEDTLGSMVAGEGSRNRYLMTQAVLSVGQLAGVEAAWASGKRLNRTGADEDGIRDAAMIRYRYNEAEQAATIYCQTGNYSPSQALRNASWYNWGRSNPRVVGSGSNQRTATDKFTRMSYVTAAYKWDRDRPPFSSVPNLEVAVRGSLVRGITQRGSTYTLNSTRTFSRSLPLILLDYLTSPFYGPNLPLSSIDLESFYRAHLIADAAVQGPTATTQRAMPVPVEACTFNGITLPCRTYADLFSALNLGTQSGVPQHENMTLHRYEYNGIVSTEEEYLDAISQIIAAAPGSAFFRSREGRYKFVVPVSSPATVAVDDDWLLGPPDIAVPDGNTKLNQLQGTFVSLGQDYAQDSITFPKPGSAAETSLLEEDMDVPLTETIALSGVTTQSHASSICATEILRSRREQYLLPLKARGISLEPGDVISFSSEHYGMSARNILVENVRLNNDLTVVVRGRRHVGVDYSWIPHSKDELRSLIATDVGAGQPASLTVTNVGSRILVRLEPNAVESDLVTNYAIERYYRASGTARAAEPEWVSVGQVASTARDIEDIWPDEGILIYRAQAIDQFGRRSEWRESGEFELDGPDAPTTVSAVIGRGVASITWNESAEQDRVAGFEVDVSIAGEWISLVYAGADARAFRYSVPDEQATYTYSVRSVGKLGVRSGRSLSNPVFVEAADLRGFRYEYVFTLAAANVNTIPAGQRASNAWGYDLPGTSGGRTWTDGAGTPTSALPKVFRQRRVVAGFPRTGDPVPAEWEAPTLEYDQTVGGMRKEYIYALVPAGQTALTDAQLPSNAWGFDRPGTVGGVTWFDGAPNATLLQPIRVFSVRDVAWNAAQGSAVSDDWSAPEVDLQLVVQGAVPGEDGNGYEWAFCRTAQDVDAIPRNQRPLDSWGFDFIQNNPQDVNGLTWFDDDPGATAAEPKIWLVLRRVEGTPPLNAPVPSPWREPKVIGLPGAIGAEGAPGRSGEDGTPGADGRDGRDGEPGMPGRDGADGADGADGSPGADGPAGTPGTAGPSGPSGPAGSAGAAGATGPPGPAGSAGPPGPPGGPGADGPRGNPGVDGTFSAPPPVANQMYGQGEMVSVREGSDFRIYVRTASNPGTF